jgi:hypothetical protein
MFFWQNCPFDGTDLETDAAVNAGGKINPVPVCALLVFAGTFVDAGDRAGIYTIGNPFTDVRYDGVRHIFSPDGFLTRQFSHQTGSHQQRPSSADLTIY